MNDQNMPLTALMKKTKEIATIPDKLAQEAEWRKLSDQGLMMTERLRIGKDAEKSSIIKMRDARGKIRIELKVQADGKPSMIFSDDNGKVVYSLPPSGKG
ncbi:MAG: hypothetical protein EOP06_20895 [Proteobacteria bacterium]|nr:MAG: hypothetical protein EOP06_20895 [Pseudomonadota bacterium]